MYEDNMRKSFKNIISSNIQVEEDFKKTINFNKTIEIEPFMKKVYDNNYRYYFFYKNQKKLNGKDIFYIRKVYDNLRGYCGLGYKLNNKNIGILFNDNSQMTKINNNFEYILYHQEDKANSKIIHIVINLPPKGISLGLENKIKFFWQIIEEFNKNKKKENEIFTRKKYL